MINRQFKKVDVIRPDSLKKTIGPSGTLRRIIKNKDYFSERGYQMEVFSHDNLFDTSHEVQKEGLSNRKSSGVFVQIKSRLRMFAKNSRMLGMLYITRDYLKVRELVVYYFKQKRTPDVVVFHSTFECYQFLKRNKKDVKTVLFFHSDGIPLKMEAIYYPKLINSWFFRRLLKMEEFCIRKVDQCVFISDIGRNNFLNYYPFVAKEKASLMLNGIEDLSAEEQERLQLNPIKQNQFKYRFCCTGTINTRKGHRIIVDALIKMDKTILKDVHVTFIGEGPERISLEKLVEDNHISEHVCFQGAVNNPDVYLHLACANIYILMSYNEGLPISIIEAMRMGLPVVSTRIAGIPELVTDGENGFLLDPDCEQLVALLNRIPDYDWELMGKNSRERFVTSFTFERMKKEYCDMLDKISK